MKARLRKYHTVYYELDKLSTEISRLKTLDGAQSYGCNAKNVLKLRKKVVVSLFRQKEQKQKELNEIDGLISLLQKSERDILICRYILCLSWNETATEMKKRCHYFSERELLRLHYHAIEHLASVKKRKDREKKKTKKRP